MSEEASTDNTSKELFDYDLCGLEEGLSTMEWLDLDVDLYVASEGNTLGNDRFRLNVPQDSIETNVPVEGGGMLVAKSRTKP